ncbi:MAG: DALR anticodon-binding domain-containing protein [Candidatus Binatia bacterium]
MKRPLEALIQNALHAAIAAGDLRVHEEAVCVVEEPEDGAFGDATCRVAMSIARAAGRPAIEIARTVAGHVRDPYGWLAGIEAAGPGFINLHASPAFWRAELGGVLERGPRGEGHPLGPASVLAMAPDDDPAGPRVTLVADAVGRLLAAAGWDVVRATVRADDASALAPAMRAGVTRCVVVGVHGAANLVAQAKRLRAEAGGDPGTTAVVAVRPVLVSRHGRPVDPEARCAVVATDTGRFAVLGEAPELPVELDLDHVHAERIDNPLFAVDYALARIGRVVRGGGAPPSDLGRLGSAERECLRLVARHHDVVDDAARRSEPHRVVRHVRAVAAAFHRYYNRHHPLCGDPTDAAAQLAMLRGIAIVLQDGLALAGVRGAEGR